MEERRLVLWDVGGVLNHFNFIEWRDNLARLFGTTRYKISELLYFEGAELGEPTFFKKIEINGDKWNPVKIYETFNERLKSADCDRQVSYVDFIRVFGAGLSAPSDFPELVRINQELNDGNIRQGILSNINTIHADAVETFFSLNDFEIMSAYRFYSCEIGLCKSEAPAAFLQACEKCCVKPENACLIDDHPENIRGAILGGGKGILHIDALSTGTKLKEFGFLPKD